MAEQTPFLRLKVLTPGEAGGTEQQGGRGPTWSPALAGRRPTARGTLPLPCSPASFPAHGDSVPGASPPCLTPAGSGTPAVPTSKDTCYSEGARSPSSDLSEHSHPPQTHVHPGAPWPGEVAISSPACPVPAGLVPGTQIHPKKHGGGRARGSVHRATPLCHWETCAARVPARLEVRHAQTRGTWSFQARQRRDS